SRVSRWTFIAISLRSSSTPLDAPRDEDLQLASRKRGAPRKGPRRSPLPDSASRPGVVRRRSPLLPDVETEEGFGSFLHLVLVALTNRRGSRWPPRRSRRSDRASPPAGPASPARIAAETPPAA